MWSSLVDRLISGDLYRAVTASNAHMAWKFTSVYQVYCINV